MTSPFRPRRRALVAGLGALATVAGLIAAPAAHAAAPSLTLDATSIRSDETVSMTFNTGTAHAKNWIGIYRDGAAPGGPASLDWRYVPEQQGTVDWGLEARDGWKQNTAAIRAGDYDVYLLAQDGYNVLAGPVDLEVVDKDAAQPADPKPEVDGVSELKALSFNIWHGGSKIPNGIQAIADIITETEADVTFLPEMGAAPAQLAAKLGYQHHSAANTGIVSRYPILSTSTVGKRWSKAVIDVNGTEVVVYGGHLEYRWYTTYLPRGYGGEIKGDWPTGWGTWNKLDAPVTDVEAILAANEQSGRPASAAELVADLAEERAAGRLAVVGGDFNEPPAQDWTDATKDLFDHNGVVIDWQTTRTLIDGGLVDTYREVHPDPVTNPGFTWPSDNELFPTSALTWAPEADERDRIDYLFATPDERLSIDASAVVGPQSTIVRNVRTLDDSADEIFTPKATWPSDHKAVLTTLRICDDGCAAAPQISLDAATVKASGKAFISGAGFEPGARLALEFPFKKGVKTTHVVTDAAGEFRTFVNIQPHTSSGEHTITVTAPSGATASATLTVTGR